MKIKQATAYGLHAMMYMVRHITQLPVNARDIARAEGIPADYLAKIFHQLVQANIVKTTRDRRNGYVFARKPEEISLLELFETTEGGPLFDDCFMKHCNCGGTTTNCQIYSIWHQATKKVKNFLEETDLVTAAWNHPDHRFFELPKNTKVSTRKVADK